MNPKLKNGQQNGGKKSRASRAGTRNVSTLNAEQLARKRTNDREAQRAIRQRTKEKIENLEKRIEELKGDPDFDVAFEEAQKKNVKLEEELAWLKLQLQLQQQHGRQISLSQNQQLQQQPYFTQTQQFQHQIPLPYSTQNQQLQQQPFRY